MTIRNGRLLSLLLVLALFVSVLSVGVYAVDIPEISCERGTALDYTIPVEGGEAATGFEYVSGSLPGGVEVSYSNGAVKLVGTPSSAGDFNYRMKITTASGGDEYNLILKIIEPAPTPTPSPTPTPTPTPSPTPVPAPSITKHPTGEIVLENGFAIFIARADYADTIEWRFVNPKNQDTVNARDVGSRFAGTHCDGYDEETLTVYNIRYEMNGWQAVCKFVGDGGSAFSDGATISVNKNGPLPPSITRDPFVTSGSDTLSVTATDPNNGVLHYQWFRSENNSNANEDGKDIKISGATSPTFVPPETEGTVYYYCAVWSSVDGENSIEAKSRVAAVTHAPQPTPSPTAAPTPEPTPASSVPPEPSETPHSSSGRSSSRFLLILMGVLILALIAAAVSLVIISRKEKELDDEDEALEESKRRRSEEFSRLFKSSAAVTAAEKKPAPAAETPRAETPAAEEQPAKAEEAPAGEPSADEGFALDGWYCAKCGSFNRGHNCTACGEEKPRDAKQYVCDHCGWTNPDPEHPPRFCPDCGTPFAAAEHKE